MVQTPIAALLDRAQRAFEAEFDRRLAESPFDTLSLAHSRNILRHLGDEPVRATQIVQQCGVTKQAISQQISHLERNGYIVVAVDPTDHRARTIALSARGCRAQTLVAQLFCDIEQEWELHVGVDELSALRAVLTKLVEDVDDCGERIEVS